MVKEDILRVRCATITKIRFRDFWVKYGFDTYEDALKELIRMAEENPQLVRGKIRWR